MYPRAFLERLLHVLTSRGQLGSRGHDRVHTLVEQGIHPEQILVGGGIISPEAYRLLLGELTGFGMRDRENITHVSELPEGFIRETMHRFQVAPLGREEGKWVLGYASPWDQGARSRIDALGKKNGWEQDPVVLLKADWNDLFSQGATTSPVHVRIAREAQEDPSSFQIRWYFDPQHSLPHSADSRIFSRVVPSAYLPALGRRLRRRCGSSVTLRHEERGSAIQVHYPAVHTDHPANWLQQSPSSEGVFPGLLVFLGTDPLFQQAVAQSSLHTLSSFDKLREEEAVRVSRPGPEDRELITHVVMAGKPATVHIPVLTDPWWEKLAEAGVPVRVIHKRVLPEGESWVSYEL